jgi:phage terminase large subunit-like protein
MFATESEVWRSAAEQLTTVRTKWQPLPHQVPPPGNWYGWLLRAGRGAGKTDACANYVVEHVKGPPCLRGPIPHWIGIIAPTQGDAATACFYGPSGIRAHDPSARLASGIGGATVKWPNGSEAKLFGAHERDDIERLRAGGNRCLIWAEELAAWRHLEDCWDHMSFGLRVGPRPHWVASTTPKPRPLIKRLIRGEVDDVVVTRGSMYDNPHLQSDIKQKLEDKYGGTKLGAQELYGELLDQSDGALWVRDQLETLRVNEVPEGLTRISVGVDPSGGAGEQGIVVVGKQNLVVTDAQGRKRNIGHGYVLGDRSCNLSPDGWGKRAIKAAIDFEADEVVVETNFGGDMAMAVIQGAADALGVPIPVRKVTASRGKRARAEPVAALAERERWHHVGRFEELEDQLCTWTDDAGYSPDRLDAMVWPPWQQKLVGTMTLNGRGTFGGRAMAQTRLG